MASKQSKFWADRIIINEGIKKNRKRKSGFLWSLRNNFVYLFTDLFGTLRRW